MRISCIFLFTLYFSFGIPAVRAQSAASAADLGLSEASVTKSDLCSADLLPAALTDLRSSGVAVSELSRYFVAGNDVHSLHAAFRVRKNSFLGPVLRTRSLAEYHHTETGVVYAMPLSAKASVGISLLTQFDRYVSRPIYDHRSAEGGLSFLLKPAKGVRIGAAAENITSSRYSGYTGERRASAVLIGLSCNIGRNATLFIAADKRPLSSARIRTGVEYKPTEHIAVRIGVANLTGQISLGTGFEFTKWSIDFAAVAFEEPGLSSACTIGYKL